jgi:uncharacterized protein (TIGR02453 family)
MAARKSAKKATKTATSTKATSKAVSKAVTKPATKASPSSIAGFHGFRTNALTFLRGLKKNNRKEWFEAHRADYENEIKLPMIALIEEVDVRLATTTPEIIGSPKRSMFRIHRDVRFSKDTSPYKTHAACWFYHRDAGREVGGEAAHGGAGFYFHFAPDGAFCGGGVWMPPRHALARIRQSLADDYQGFEDIVLSAPFKRRFGPLDDEGKLTRVPRGFSPEHPAAEWLRFQSFTAGCALTTDELLSPTLPDVLGRHFAAMAPLVRWLNAASGLKAASAR